MPGNIVHHGHIVFGKVNTWDLAVSTCNEPSPEDAIPLDLEYPLGLDTMSATWNH